MSTITTEIHRAFGVSVIVKRTNESTLSAEKWQYSYDERENKLHLRVWKLLEKPTSRHKYRVTECWDKMDKRDSTVAVPPPVAAEIREAALTAFRESIQLEA